MGVIKRLSLGVIQKHRNLGQPSLPHSLFVPLPPCPPSFAPAMHAKHLTTFLKGNIPLAIGNTRMKEAGKLHVVCCAKCRFCYD